MSLGKRILRALVLALGLSSTVGVSAEGQTSTDATTIHAGDSTVHSDYASAVSSIEKYIAFRKRFVCREEHAPILLHHGHRTAGAVVLYHGLYDSPKYMRGLAQFFYNGGYNVLSVLLPGHWDVEFDRIRTVTATEWRNELELTIPLAAELGDHLISVGFSTGGTLSVMGSLLFPDLVSGLVLLAPALRQSLLSTASAGVAWGLGITGNVLLPFNPRPGCANEQALFAPEASFALDDLINDLRSLLGQSQKKFGGRILSPYAYDRLSIPLFMVLTDNDIVIANGEAMSLYRKWSGPKELIRYSLLEGMDHDSIHTSTIDEKPVKRGNINLHFDEMTTSIARFLRAQGL